MNYIFTDDALNLFENLNLKSKIVVSLMMQRICSIRPTFLLWSSRGRLIRPYFKSKLELNSKKSNSSDAKKILSCLYLSYFALKAELQVLKFEYCQVKLW